MSLTPRSIKALEYFLSNFGEKITVNDIVEQTGWAVSTVRTYINKKWKNIVLEKSPTRDLYRVILPQDTTQEQFEDLQTQVDKRTR